jgi:hypothetical protein
VQREVVTDPAQVARIEQAMYYLSLVPHAPTPGSPATNRTPYEW